MQEVVLYLNNMNIVKEHYENILTCWLSYRTANDYVVSHWKKWENDVPLNLSTEYVE